MSQRKPTPLEITSGMFFRKILRQHEFCSMPAFADGIKHLSSGARRMASISTATAVNLCIMPLSAQTAILLQAARQLADELPADAVLILTETDLDWAKVLEFLPADKLLVVAEDPELSRRLRAYDGLTVLEIDPGPTPTQERMSLALLEAVALEKLRAGAHVIA